MATNSLFRKPTGGLLMGALSRIRGMPKLAFSVAILSICALGCGSDPQVSEQVVDLSNRSHATTGMTLEVGNQTNVSVVIRQEGNDMYAICGHPSVHDPFGNVLMTMAPSNVKPGREATYQFALNAASTGRYTVEFDNRECDVRITPAEATVQWTVG